MRRFLRNDCDHDFEETLVERNFTPVDVNDTYVFGTVVDKIERRCTNCDTTQNDSNRYVARVRAKKFDTIEFDSIDNVV